MSPEWRMEEWLYSVRARIANVQKLSEEALEAMKEFFRVLWSKKTAPATIRELAEVLSGAQDRMIEWCESAARVGADEALCYILSFYETLELEKIIGVREGSKWIEDPSHVETWQKKAQSIIEWADILEFRADPNAPAVAEGETEAEAMAREVRYKYANDSSDFYESEDEGEDAEDDEDEAEGEETEGEEEMEESEPIDEEIVVEADSSVVATSVPSATAPSAMTTTDPSATTTTEPSTTAPTDPSATATIEPSAAVTASTPSGDATAA